MWCQLIVTIRYVCAFACAAGAGGDDNRRGDRNASRIFEASCMGNRPGPKTCPRCFSHNIKFSYYNNRSLAQPRYLCRRCKRTWTHGGIIRDVPVGGRRRSVARNPRVVLPPTTDIASSSRQPGQIMLDSPLPTQLGGVPPLATRVVLPSVTNMASSSRQQVRPAAYQLGGVPPRAVEGSNANEHRANRMMPELYFDLPNASYQEHPSYYHVNTRPRSVRSANVPRWDVTHRYPLPRPPPPQPQPQPQTEVVSTNPAENDMEYDG